MSLKNKKAIFIPLLTVAALLASGTTASHAAASKGLVGFSYPIEANTYLKAIGLAAQATLTKAGYTMLPIDAQLDGNKQISDVETMISKKVKAMIIYPLDSNGMKPVLTKAAAAGIKVITMNYSVDDSVKAPPVPSLAQVQDGFPQRSLATARVAWLKKVLPQGGNVLYVGLGFPVAALEMHAKLFKEELGKEASFTYLGRVDNKSDDSEGGRQAVDEALIKYPNIDAIVAYNDPTALGAYSSIKAAGKAGKIKVIGLQMQPEAVNSITAGEINGSWDFNPVASGVSLATLTVSILKGEAKSKWSKTIQTPAVFFDKTTIGKFVPWDTRVKKLK
ncbi:MAG: sugar ABC transporter substrate-binding protein [Actinomycetes bacterium]